MKISEYDKRQLVKMQQQLLAYKRGVLPLGSLIEDLDFLLNLMESVPISWKKSMHDILVTLEEVNAVSLDLGQAEPDKSAVSIISESIQELDRQLTKVINIG